MPAYSLHWIHVKSEGLYEIVAMAKIEATLEDVVVYRCLEEGDGRVWVRPRHEFFDGRFVAIPPTPEA